MVKLRNWGLRLGEAKNFYQIGHMVPTKSVVLAKDSMEENINRMGVATSKTVWNVANIK